MRPPNTIQILAVEILTATVIDTGCWIPRRPAQKNGYVNVSIKNMNRGLHRASYEWACGPIPEGLVIDHLCHGADPDCPGGHACLHRRCCNPTHLEAVTLAENVRRGQTGKVTGERFRARTHCKHGHPLRGSNLKIRKGDGSRQCRACLRSSWERANARRAGA